MSAMATVVYKVGDDVSTDAIYPAASWPPCSRRRRPSSASRRQGVQHRAAADTFAPGSIIVGGQNFGCGSSGAGGIDDQGPRLVVIAAGSRGSSCRTRSIWIADRHLSAIEAEVGDEIDLTPPTCGT